MSEQIPGPWDHQDIPSYVNRQPLEGQLEMQIKDGTLEIPLDPYCSYQREDVNNG